jgi:hypothetical protein
MKTFQPLQDIMLAKAALGIGSAKLVEDFKTVIMQLSGITTPTATIKFQVSYADEMPDFNAAQSVSNPWDYIEVVDLQDGTVIDGDTGVAFTGSADFRQFELNTNGARWVNAVITAYTAGAYTVKMKAYDAQ